MLQVTAGRRPWRRAVVAATIAGCPADAGRRARTFQNSTSSSKDGSSSSTNSARWLGPLTDSVAPMYLAANASCEFLSIWPVRSVTSKLSAAAGASTSRGGRAPMSSGSIQPQSIAVRTASASDVGCGTRTARTNRARDIIRIAATNFARDIRSASQRGMEQRMSPRYPICIPDLSTARLCVCAACIAFGLSRRARCRATR